MKKPSIKLAKTAQCGYIYEDRHAVIVHQDIHPKAGAVKWVEIIERIPAACGFTGRLVFHHPDTDLRFVMALNAYEIQAVAPKLDAGSENTKKLGIAIGYLTISTSENKELRWIMMPDVISDGITLQPQNRDTFNEGFGESVHEWCGHAICKVHRVAPLSERVSSAA